MLIGIVNPIIIRILSVLKPIMSAYFNLKNLKMIKIGDKKYQDIKDYAANKAVTIQTVYNWIKNEDVKTRKFMGKTLIEL